jgi:hypothetical protein
LRFELEGHEPAEVELDPRAQARISPLLKSH